MPSQATYGIKQALPYSWYRQHFIQNQNLDDAGHSSQPISEAEWNAMDPNQQYSAVSIGSYGVDPNDEVLKGITDRYAAAGNQGQGVMANEVNKFNDQGRVWTDPTTGIRMTSQDNIYKSPDRITPAIGIGTVLGAGLLGNMYGLGGEGGFTPSMAGGPPDSYWGMTADGGNIMSDAGGLDAIEAGENVGSMTPMSPTSAASFSNTPWGNAELAAHNIGVGNPGNVLDRISSSVMNDPFRAAQTGNALLGMFGGVAGASGGGDGNEGPTELGDSGWRPPVSDPYAPRMYTKPGSEFSGWQEQYDRSRMPLSKLKAMYG